MTNETNRALELARIEAASFGQETRNRADGIIPEILQHLKVTSLAEVREADLDAFRYQANIAAESDLYQLLLIRRQLALVGVSWNRRAWEGTH